MHCPKCGNPIEPDDLFCGECGHKIEKRSKAVHSAERDISNAEHTESEAPHQDSTGNNKSMYDAESMNEQHSTTQHKGQQQVSHEQQRPHHHNTSTYEQHTHPQSYHSYQDKQQQQANQPNQFSEQAKEVTEESKGFFKSAFVSPDQIIKSQHTFSFKLLFSLLIIGLILIALLIGAMIPSEVAYIGTSKGSIVISILLGIVLFLAVIIGATYGVTRLVVRQPITFKKVLSDYVLINSVTVAVLLISIILFFAHSYRFASTVFILSILLLVVSGVYLIAKYSANHDTRLSSFYGIIIFSVVVFLFISIFGESFFNQIFGNLIDRLGDIFEGGMNY